MPRKSTNLIESQALSRINHSVIHETELSIGAWLKLLRGRLRITQAQLARRAGMAQSHVALIESGKSDPQISTLNRIFGAMSIHLVLRPRLDKSFDEILRSRARTIALKRLKQSMGTMSLEKQAPDSEAFGQLLEKRTDDILHDKRERLWE